MQVRERVALFSIVSKCTKLCVLFPLTQVITRHSKAAEGCLLMCDLGESLAASPTKVIRLPWYRSIDSEPESEVEKNEASRHETLHDAS